MTAYNAIADSDIDPESPGTTTLFSRLRDNPIAIAEGSSGAPSIQSGALEQTGGSEAVIAATINKVIVSDGTQAISALGSWIPSAGFYNIAAQVDIQFSVYVGGAWRNHEGIYGASGKIWCDGTNMRLYNSDTVSTKNVYWQKMS